MNSLIKTTIKRPVTVCILVIVLMAVGVLATLDTSTNLLPNIKMPMLGISVVYPGASAQSVQNDVTQPIERALQTVPGITDLQTKSYDNASVAVLTFDYGTDIDAKIDVIQDAFKSVTLPDGCYEPSFIQIDMNGTATATISVYSPNGDMDALAADADTLATKLRSIEGVGSVDVMGSPTRQIRITALQGLDITALLIVQSLSNENLDIPLGSIMQDGTTVSIRNASDATSVLQVMQLPAKLELGSAALESFAALKAAVNAYAYCTMSQFTDYVQKARDAKTVIDDIEGKSAAELSEQRDGITAAKALMTLLRNNSSQTLRLYWHTINAELLQNDEFLNMSESDLRALADQINLSYDVLKWLQDGAKDGTIKQNWDKLVRFRECCPESDVNDDGELNGDDITYDQFACLFQDGGSVTADGAVKRYEGLDLLHSQQAHADCDADCTRRIYTHDQAADVCEFADSVNTVAYDDIVDTVTQAEQDGVKPQITDEQFAALFVNSTQSQQFAAVMSPQIIHIIRLENFDNGKGSIVDVLTDNKSAHVDTDGDAVYGNGVKVHLDDDGKPYAEINGVRFAVNAFGRLTDDDGRLVDDNGTVIDLSDEQIAANYYSYGDYVVFTDRQLLDLYNNLGADTDIGITPTADTVRFVRICQFDTSGSTLVVPLAYIGYVSSYSDSQAYAQYNGQLSVTIQVYAVSGANTTDVVDSVKSVLAQTSVTSGVALLDDKAEFINDSIRNVLSSIIIGGVLAVLVIYLFVRKIGSSLVVSITMPLSVLVALCGLWIMNISLNLVSLGGLAVGIGMLVDNSIVVLESITKRRDRGENIFDSCLNGTKEVAGSLFASTLTNVCVFFPILFARGLTREIFYDLVWAVLFSIVMSLLVAITVIPSLYHLIYRKQRTRTKRTKDGGTVIVNLEDGEPREHTPVKADGKGNRKPESKRAARRAKYLGKIQRVKARVNINRMENGYGKILSKVLRYRVAVCVVALVLFASSVALVFTTGTEFMPGVDKGVIEVTVSYDAATDLDEATASGKTIADAISAHFGDKLQYVSLTVGKQGILATSDSSVIRIQTDTSALNTEQTVKDIRALISGLSAQYTNVTVREMDGVVAEVTGGMSNQSVTLTSDDMDLLRAVAAKVSDKLRSADPEHIVNVTDNTPLQTEQINFTFDKTLCADKGVDYQNAVLLLRVGMSGYVAANLDVDGEMQDVNVLFKDATASDIDSLLNIVVGFGDDGVVLLKDVLVTDADGNCYTTETVESTINMQNGKYSTTIDVEISDIDSGSAGKIIGEAVNQVLADYPEITYSEGGVASYLNDAFDGLVVSLIAAFVLLYSVMACQFESLSKPFIVIASIPFAFTGGFLALAITGMTLNVVSFVGLIMLMGVIVNGAIVMIDKINMLIDEGLTPQQAVIEGCKSRLRPILMTTLTTVLALVPLALGLGSGGELMQPMGIVVLGGLLLGTMVTLVLIPCFYCIVKRVKFTAKDVYDDTGSYGQPLQADDSDGAATHIGNAEEGNNSEEYNNNNADADESAAVSQSPQAELGTPSAETSDKGQ